MVNQFLKLRRSTLPEKSGSVVSWLPDLYILLFSLGILATAMMHLHTMDSGLSGPDEGSHFLNALMIWSYCTEALGKSPLAYATQFYIHYPKISIGHWPPLYYLFFSGFFFVLPHQIAPFLIANLFMDVLPVLLISRVVRRLLGLPWALLAAFIYVMIPLTMNNSMRLMLDQPLAALCFVAALAWRKYGEKPELKWGLTYALMTAAAILVKGNGWVLAVFPLFYIFLTQRWNLLTNWRTYCCAALALLLVGFWSVATYKISNDGFNYAWGFDYFKLAMASFLSAGYKNLGVAGLTVTAIGIAGSIRQVQNGEMKEFAMTGLAMILATLLFHSIVPVDIDPRYLTSAIPFVAIFMVIGVWMIAQRLGPTAVNSTILIAGSTLILSIPGWLFLKDRPPRYDLHMNSVATTLVDYAGISVVVIDGDTGSEGSLTAEVALRDTGRQIYVVRSSTLLAISDFMGKKYALRVTTPEEVLTLLNTVSCNAVVVSQGKFSDPEFEHSKFLLSALELPFSGFHLVNSYPHVRHDGMTKLYLRDVRVALNINAVRRVNFPQKAPGQ